MTYNNSARVTSTIELQVKNMYMRTTKTALITIIPTSLVSTIIFIVLKGEGSGLRDYT